MIHCEALPQPSRVTVHKSYHVPGALFPIIKLPWLSEAVVKNDFKVFEVPRSYNKKPDKEQVIVTGK